MMMTSLSMSLKGRIRARPSSLMSATRARTSPERPGTFCSMTHTGSVPRCICLRGFLRRSLSAIVAISLFYRRFGVRILGLEHQSMPIPDDQRVRVQLIVDTLLEQLRQQTQLLTTETGFPFEFDPEAAE